MAAVDTKVWLQFYEEEDNLLKGVSFKYSPDEIDQFEKRSEVIDMFGYKFKKVGSKTVVAKGDNLVYINYIFMFELTDEEKERLTDDNLAEEFRISFK